MDGGLATRSPHGLATDHLRAPGQGVGEDHADLHVVTYIAPRDPERVHAALPTPKASECGKGVNLLLETFVTGLKSRSHLSSPA